MQLTHHIDGITVSVATEEFPLQEAGRPGSILDLALGNGIRLNHSCGGTGACTTCHVYVLEGLEFCGEPGATERERLKEVYGLQANSRLACQCVPSGPVKVEIP